MTWDWARYLDLARALRGCASLAETPPAMAEAMLRAAASRAYYAAFHVAREWAVARNNYVSPRVDAHQSLIKHFRRGGASRAEQQTSRDLQGARICRENADYDDTLTTPRTWIATADNAIKYAEEIVARLAAP